jgi:cytochrome c oxidase subunit II
VIRKRTWVALWPVLVLAGCTGPQSALQPDGPSAGSIHQLGTVMYVAAALVAILVTTLVLIPLLRPRNRPANQKLFLWGGGVALPLVTLSVLVPYVMTIGHETRAPSRPDQLSVDVTGHQYWWAMSYRRIGASGATSANELRIPVGEPVQLFLRSTDVIHSFWAPRLAGKTDLIPGQVNRMVIRADRPGVYRGQCAEYCGRQHAHMAFHVVALPRAEFDVWLARLERPVPEPASSELRQGRDLFLSLGCGACHTIRGVSNGRAGPDLTQVGSRRIIGAGVLGGGVGNIAGWIASAQHLKPGIAMPSFPLEGPKLRAVAAYLGSLK